ncbi:MAG TPA: DUF5666 domain-containing protein [bacterium]|nr:DUF5666 domain-containing protein [bacterium]
MRNKSLLLWTIIALAVAALGSPVTGAAPASQVEGTISAVGAGTIMLAGQTSTPVRVVVTQDTVVLQRSSATLETIKANNFVGVTARRESDGSLTAISINIFPPEFRGRIREAQFVMDTGNVMTNATVFQSVRRIAGRTLYLKVNDGSVVIAVPKDAEVRRLTVMKAADLRPGAHVLARGTFDADGAFVAAGITVDAP